MEYSELYHELHKAAYTALHGREIDEGQRQRMGEALAEFEDRLGTTVAAPIANQKRQFLKTLARKYVPTREGRTGRVVKNWAGTLFPLTTLAHLGDTLYTSRKLEHPDDSFYNTTSGSIHTGGMPEDIGTLAHEVGHAVNIETGMESKSLEALGKKKIQKQYRRLRLIRELQASLLARKMLGEQAWKKNKGGLSGALATYFIGHALMNPSMPPIDEKGALKGKGPQLKDLFYKDHFMPGGQLSEMVIRMLIAGKMSKFKTTLRDGTEIEGETDAPIFAPRSLAPLTDSARRITRLADQILEKGWAVSDYKKQLAEQQRIQRPRRKAAGAA